MTEPRPRYNAGFSLDRLVDSLSPGLDRAVLRVLSFHVGRGAAIGRAELVEEVARLGFPVGERAVRAQINLLRKEGALICSTGGVDGGYFLATCWEELDEYLQSEIHSRAMDLLEQEKALRQAGEKKWGAQSLQIDMFK